MGLTVDAELNRRAYYGRMTDWQLVQRPQDQHARDERQRRKDEGLDDGTTTESYLRRFTEELKLIEDAKVVNAVIKVTKDVIITVVIGDTEHELTSKQALDLRNALNTVILT